MHGAVLQGLMGDSERGLTPISDVNKVRYGDLRRALLVRYATQGNKSLQAPSSGESAIRGLRALDEFFGFSAANPGVHVTQITTDAARDFAAGGKWRVWATQP
jgi:hypothetical protein